jgi:hypothetical protein
MPPTIGAPRKRRGTVALRTRTAPRAVGATATTGQRNAKQCKADSLAETHCCHGGY